LTYGQKTSQDVSYMTFWDETVLITTYCIPLLKYIPHFTSLQHNSLFTATVNLLWIFAVKRNWMYWCGMIHTANQICLTIGYKTISFRE